MNNPIFKLAEKYGVRISVSYSEELHYYNVKIEKGPIQYSCAFTKDFPCVTEEEIYEYIETKMIPPVLREYEKWNQSRIEEMKRVF